MLSRLNPSPQPSPKERGSYSFLKLQLTSRDHHRSSADADLLNFAWLAFNFQPDAAGTIDEIALLNHKFVNAVNRIYTSRAMMNQITTQGPGGAPRCRIFTDVL